MPEARFRRSERAALWSALVVVAAAGAVAEAADAVEAIVASLP